MIKKQKHITVGVKETVSELTQIILWNMIDQLGLSEEIPLDYLQIFELAPVKLDGQNAVQKIVHRQEQPAYRHTIHLTLPEIIQAKIYVISGTSDDGEIITATMMLEEE